MRRRHKKPFLEILGTCKQVHGEGSGIIYGCNVFKYRSNPEDGHRPVIPPTRHLQLLKHIKISVISRYPAQDNQENCVAGLVRSFVKDGLSSETFELTWFGWKLHYLREPLLQALKLIKVKEQFVIKVAGEARMNTEVQQDLERSLVSVRVEIHRAVSSVAGEEDEGS